MLVTYGYNHGAPVRAVDADGYVDALDELFTPAPWMSTSPGDLKALPIVIVMG